MPVQQLIRFSWSKAKVTKGQKASFMAISPDRIEIDHPGPYTGHVVADSTDYRLFTLGLSKSKIKVTGSSNTIGPPRFPRN